MAHPERQTRERKYISGRGEYLNNIMAELCPDNEEDQIGDGQSDDIKPLQDDALESTNSTIELLTQAVTVPKLSVDAYADQQKQCIDYVLKTLIVSGLSQRKQRKHKKNVARAVILFES